MAQALRERPKSYYVLLHPPFPLWVYVEQSGCTHAGIIHLLQDIRILDTSEVASTRLQGAHAERQGGNC